MTEAEWLACDNRQPMLEHFRGAFSARKLRLFACGCCRRVWDQLSEDSKTSLKVAEQFADGTASSAALDRAETLAFAATRTAEEESVCWATNGDAWMAAFDASYCAAGREAVLGWPGRSDSDDAHFEREHAFAATLLRDVFGNPFRPVTFDPRWRTGDTSALARGIYEDRAFDRLPLLADALMDAGCDDEQVLSHCRGDGPHVRGCWVVDLVLGRE